MQQNISELLVGFAIPTTAKNGASTMQINIVGLPNGLYIVKSINNRGIVNSEKLLKQ